MKNNKTADKDFRKDQLPHNRKEQFFDIFKTRYRLFFSFSLILTLLFLPFLGVLIYKDSTIMAIYNGGYDNVTERIFTISLIYIGLLLFASIIFFIGLAGLFKIFKELIYGEPVFFKEDFIQGIKDNFKPFLVIAIFVWIFSAVDRLISISFSNTWYIEIIPSAINFSLIFPICYVSLFITSVYTNTFSINLKSAIIIYFKHFPSVLLGYIFSFGILLIKYIPLLYLKYSLFAILVILVLPISLFAGFENHMRIFDELVNKNQYPDYYKKGLYN